MKVRRRAIEDRYRQLIDDMYAHAEVRPGCRSHRPVTSFAYATGPVSLQ